VNHKAYDTGEPPAWQDKDGVVWRLIEGKYYSSSHLAEEPITREELMSRNPAELWPSGLRKETLYTTFS